MAPELPNGKGEMEVPMSDEVREFREGQDEEYANWVKRHGTSHVLNLKSQSHAVLHEVDCMHIAISPDYRSLGQPKVGARRTRRQAYVDAAVLGAGPRRVRGVVPHLHDVRAVRDTRGIPGPEGLP